MLSNDQLRWTQSFLGRPDLGAATAQTATGTSANGTAAPKSFPQPMQHDCKVVHGKVPGPKNFVLCATHGHILDTDKKQIVAANLNDFNAAHPEFGKLPVAMLPDCAIVHGKVPGPKHHVLCGTHGHILDEEKQQIIAHSLSEYLHNHMGQQKTSHGSAHGPSQHSGPAGQQASQTATHVDFSDDEAEPVTGHKPHHAGSAHHGHGRKPTHVDFDDAEVEPINGRAPAQAAPTEQQEPATTEEPPDADDSDSDTTPGNDPGRRKKKLMRNIHLIEKALHGLQPIFNYPDLPYVKEVAQSCADEVAEMAKLIATAREILRPIDADLAALRNVDFSHSPNVAGMIGGLKAASEALPKQIRELRGDPVRRAMDSHFQGMDDKDPARKKFTALRSEYESKVFGVGIHWAELLGAVVEVLDMFEAGYGT